MTPPLRIAALLACTLGALACDDRSNKTKKVLEAYAVVPGTPTVDTGEAKVLTDPTRENDKFAINTPRQCDVYQQLSVRKVDILWVVDSSGSMAPKQARLAANFQGFIQQLVTANPPIDFHIGVISTDTDDPATRGAMRTWTIGPRSNNFIGCTPQMAGGTSCNTNPGMGTADAVTAFQQMAAVGTGGSAHERGLYNLYLALNNPANKSTMTQERFIRNDAALYVVVVSDEDDASCHPLVKQGICTADPGCRCASDQTLGQAGYFGATGYYARFLETYKGYGNAELVALAAIVALEGDPDAGVPSQFGDPSQHIGCCRAAGGGPCPTSGTNDGGFEIGYFGDRYIKVAAATGGVAVSICDNDFSAALSALGYAASGLRREFRLTRGPDVRAMAGKATGITLYVSPPNAGNCTVDGNCPVGQVCRSGRCAVKQDVNTAFTANAAQYAKCDGLTFRNVIRFDGTAVPPSLSAVEICYDVQPEAQPTCP